MSDRHCEGEEDLVVAEAPLSCWRCGAGLCLRKQVINLTMGNTEKMYCLVCLSEDGSQSVEELLSGIKGYVLSRECFRKEWIRYKDVQFCPDPEHCYPKVCFGTQETECEH